MKISAVSATQRIDVHDGSTVAARISSTEANRIAIRDGRVHKVWGADGKASLKPDSDTGQLYVLPSESRHTQAFSLFIQDESSAVYTLVLTPAKVPAETIILVRPQVRKTQQRKQALIWETSAPYERTVLNLIRNMATGNTPEGYTHTPASRRIHLWKEVHLTLTDRYLGANLGGEVYRLTNIDSKPMRLDEREFYRDGVLAVSIDKPALKSNSTTSVYLVVQEGGK